jgi:hypothetical protein
MLLNRDKTAMPVFVLELDLLATYDLFSNISDGLKIVSQAFWLLDLTIMS